MVEGQTIVGQIAYLLKVFIIGCLLPADTILKRNFRNYGEEEKESRRNA